MNGQSSSNPIHGEVYSIQHYVMMFVSDLGQVSGLLRFPPPIKLTAMNQIWMSLAPLAIHQISLNKC
jgi:hypothetical protein